MGKTIAQTDCDTCKIVWNEDGHLVEYISKRVHCENTTQRVPAQDTTTLSLLPLRHFIGANFYHLSDDSIITDEPMHTDPQGISYTVIYGLFEQSVLILRHQRVIKQR